MWDDWRVLYVSFIVFSENLMFLNFVQSKSQKSVFERAVNDLVKQREEIEAERVLLLTKMENLANEVSS